MYQATKRDGRAIPGQRGHQYKSRKLGRQQDLYIAPTSILHLVASDCIDLYTRLQTFRLKAKVAKVILDSFEEVATR